MGYLYSTEYRATTRWVSSAEDEAKLNALPYAPPAGTTFIVSYGETVYYKICDGKTLFSSLPILSTVGEEGGVVSVTGALVTGTSSAPIINIPTDSQITTAIIDSGGSSVNETLAEGMVSYGNRLVALEQGQDANVILGGQQTSGPMIVGATNNQDLALISNNATLLLLQTDGSITATGDLHMSEKKVINIADGTDPRDAVTVQQSNLQGVTLRGHSTDRGIVVTGSAGGSPTDGLFLANDADLGTVTIFGYNGNVQSGGLSISANGTELAFGTDATIALTQGNILIEHHASGSNIGLTAQDAGNSGVQISARVTVQDAVLPVEAVTLAQLNAAVGQTVPASGGTMTGPLVVSTSATIPITTIDTSGGGAGVVSISDNGAAIANGARVGYKLFGGATDASSTIYHSAGMEAHATEAWTSTAAGTVITFDVTPNGTLTRTTALEIGNDGTADFKGNSLAAIGGLNFGSEAVTDPQDLSRHITLYDPGFGINITAQTMNFNVNLDVAPYKFAFYEATTLVAVIENVISDPKALTTKEYVDAAIAAAIGT